MSLMNCTFTVRWSDEKNEPHAKTYATKEDAERSIKENRADWLAYFGIKEWE